MENKLTFDEVHELSTHLLQTLKATIRFQVVHGIEKFRCSICLNEFYAFQLEMKTMNGDQIRLCDDNCLQAAAEKIISKH